MLIYDERCRHENASTAVLFQPFIERNVNEEQEQFLYKVTCATRTVRALDWIEGLHTIPMLSKTVCITFVIQQEQLQSLVLVRERVSNSGSYSSSIEEDSAVGVHLYFFISIFISSSLYNLSSYIQIKFYQDVRSSSQRVHCKNKFCIKCNRKEQDQWLSEESM